MQHNVTMSFEAVEIICGTCGQEYHGTWKDVKEAVPHIGGFLMIGNIRCTCGGFCDMTVGPCDNN